MAELKLADLIARQEFVDYARQDMIEKSTLIRSGIAVPDPVIAAKVAAGSGLEGKTLDMPSLESLDTAGDAEIPVEATGATADKVGAVNDTAPVQFLRKKFGVTDVATILGRVDPMAHIVSQLTPFWLKQDNKRFVSLLTGVFAANDASNDGDMTFDVSGEAGTAANLAKDTILLGAQKMGDRSDELTAVVMNSATEAYLAAMDTNAGLYRASEAPGRVATYNGRAIIVDDNVPYDAANKKATIYLCGRGVAAYNELPVPHAFEMDRNADTAVDYIHSWRRFILHVRGMKWVGSMAGLGPTTAEIEAAGSWQRVFDRRRIPLVRVIAKLG